MLYEDFLFIQAPFIRGSVRYRTSFEQIHGKTKPNKFWGLDPEMGRPCSSKWGNFRGWLEFEFENFRPELEFWDLMLRANLSCETYELKTRKAQQN